MDTPLGSAKKFRLPQYWIMEDISAEKEEG